MYPVCSDIVNKCMFNMAEVTDSEEIHLAATQVPPNYITDVF